MRSRQQRRVAASGLVRWPGLRRLQFGDSALESEREAGYRSPHFDRDNYLAAGIAFAAAEPALKVEHRL